MKSKNRAMNLRISKILIAAWAMLLPGSFACADMFSVKSEGGLGESVSNTPFVPALSSKEKTEQHPPKIKASDFWQSETVLRKTQIPILTPDSKTIWGIPGNPAITYVAPPGAKIREGAKIQENGSGESFLHLEFQTNDAGWAGGGFSYDDLKTKKIETADFSRMDYLSFGLMANADQIKFEVVDAQNRKAIFYLDTEPHGTATFRVETKQLCDLGINVSQVRLLYFIVEGKNLSGDIVVNYGSTQSSLEKNGELFDGLRLITGQKEYGYVTSSNIHCGRAYCPTNLWLQDVRTGKINYLGGFTGKGRIIELSAISPKNAVGGQVVIAQGFGPEDHESVYIARVDDLAERLITYNNGVHEDLVLDRIQFTDHFAFLYRRDGSAVWVNLKKLERINPSAAQLQVLDFSQQIYQAGQQLQQMALKTPERSIVKKAGREYIASLEGSFRSIEKTLRQEAPPSYYNLRRLWGRAKGKLLNAVLSYHRASDASRLFTAFELWSQTVLKALDPSAP